jgi:hypothetical protein
VTVAIEIGQIWSMANLANLKGGPAKTHVWHRSHPVCRNSGSWGGALPRPGGPIYFPRHHRPTAKLVSGRRVLAFFGLPGAFCVAVFCFFFARNHVFGQHSSLWQNLKIGIGATYATNRASATPTYLRHEAPFGALENAQGGAKGSLIKSENEKKLFWFP